jgi:hypothetical protein
MCTMMQAVHHNVIVRVRTHSQLLCQIKQHRVTSHRRRPSPVSPRQHKMAPHPTSHQTSQPNSMAESAVHCCQQTCMNAASRCNRQVPACLYCTVWTSATLHAREIRSILVTSNIYLCAATCIECQVRSERSTACSTASFVLVLIKLPNILLSSHCTKA